MFALHLKKQDLEKKDVIRRSRRLDVLNLESNDRNCEIKSLLS